MSDPKQQAGAPADSDKPSGDKGERSNPNARDTGDSYVPFTVEFGDAYCRNHTINTPPFQMNVRGAFSIAALASRPEGMRTLGEAAGRIPEMPGAMLSVNLRTGQVRLWDPCDETANGRKALERYNALAATTPALTKFKPFEAIEHQLDADHLKTLVMELKQKLESQCCRVAVGDFPDEGQLKRLKGRLLFDPWNTNFNKPRYADEYEDWRASPQARL